jgi:hypothetical protein
VTTDAPPRCRRGARRRRPARARPLEGEAEVRHRDLRTLQKRDLAIAVTSHVPVEGHRRERLDQSRRRPPGRLHGPHEAPSMAIQQEGAQIAKRPRVEIHELRDLRYGRILPQRPRELFGAQLAESACRPGPFSIETIREGEGYGEVARAPRTLGEMGEPARPEVDRVEREHVGERLLVCSPAMVGRILGGVGRRIQQLEAERLQPLRVDPDRASASRDLRAGSSDPLEDPRRTAQAVTPKKRSAPGTTSIRTGSLPTGSPSSSIQISSSFRGATRSRSRRRSGVRAR